MATVKKTLLLFFTIGVFVTCSSTFKNTERTSDPNFKAKDVPISFTGYWLCKDYFESINSFKSPKKAQVNSAFIYVPDRTLKPTMMIANFHEGGPTLTILSHADQYELWEVEEGILTQRIDKIEIIDKTNIKIGNRLFVKISPLMSNYGARILEEILFKGIYTNASGATIEFKNDGQVVGLENFNSYEPQIDYSDAGMQVDQIGLGKNNTDFDYFGFKFHKDTLELFKLHCLTFDTADNRCVEVELGQQTHKLWKKQ